MRWLLVACLSSACFAAVVGGTFLPLRDADGLEYLFVWSGGPALAATVGITTGVLASLYALVLTLARRQGPGQLAAARSGRWLAPLAGLGCVLGGILPAVPGIGERAASVAYFLYDLRWWWAITLASWTAWRADRLLGQPIGQRLKGVSNWSPAVRLLALDGALFSLAVAWAIGTSPHIRFDGSPFGDEPKYLRYCEAWYQGKGCDLSENQPLTEMPLDAPSAVVENVRLLAGAIKDETSAMVSDLQGFVRDPLGFRWNRHSEVHDGFLTGKRGTGLYQIHQPGLSAVLFPGYFIDRHLLAKDAGYQNEFPADLPMTTTTMLTIYALCGVALFRLLRRALASEALAWAAAALGVMTFPTSAFAFQLYPEIPALLIIVSVVNYACFHASSPPPRLVTAASAGAAAAALAWLHPRFLAVSAVLFAASMLKTRGPGRPAFGLAYTLVLLAFGGYTYHITGSWMPNAFYEGADVHQLVLGNIVDNLISYAFHSTFGLVPHAPWLFAAVPGLIVMGRRGEPAVFVALVALALAVPAAGHALNAGSGATPGRFVVAVVPLLIWPTALLVRQAWSSRAMRVATVLVVVLSLDAAFSYNWNHEKPVGTMVDAAISGWKPNLAFPEIREYLSDASQRGYAVFLGFATSVAGSIAVAVRARLDASSRPVPARSTTFRTAALLVAIVIAGSAMATAVIRRWTREEYQLTDNVARRRAAEALVALDRCRVCFTSRRPQVDWRWLSPNPVRDPETAVSTDGRLVSVRVDLGDDGFGQMAVDFGDGTSSPIQGVLGNRDVSHKYRTAGSYKVVISLRLRDGDRVNVRGIAVE